MAKGMDHMTSHDMLDWGSSWASSAFPRSILYSIPKLLVPHDNSNTVSNNKISAFPPSVSQQINLYLKGQGIGALEERKRH